MVSAGLPWLSSSSKVVLRISATVVLSAWRSAAQNSSLSADTHLSQHRSLLDLVTMTTTGSPEHRSLAVPCDYLLHSRLEVAERTRRIEALALHPSHHLWVLRPTGRIDFVAACVEVHVWKDDRELGYDAVEKVEEALGGWVGEFLGRGAVRVKLWRATLEPDAVTRQVQLSACSAEPSVKPRAEHRYEGRTE